MYKQGKAMPKIDYEITVEQDIPAGMEPFDLERALAGDPVVTRDGCDVLEMHYFESSVETYRLYAVSDRPERAVFSYNNAGRRALDGKPCDYDLFMKKKTHTVNGFEVPVPENKIPELGKVIYLADPSSLDFCRALWFDDNAIDHRWLERGIIFLNPLDAIINAKAMIGINPYDE